MLLLALFLDKFAYLHFEFPLPITDYTLLNDFCNISKNVFCNIDI